MKWIHPDKLFIIPAPFYPLHLKGIFECIHVDNAEPDSVWRHSFVLLWTGALTSWTWHVRLIMPYRKWPPGLCVCHITPFAMSQGLEIRAPSSPKRDVTGLLPSGCLCFVSPLCRNKTAKSVEGQKNWCLLYGSQWCKELLKFGFGWIAILFPFVQREKNSSMPVLAPLAALVQGQNSSWAGLALQCVKTCYVLTIIVLSGMKFGRVFLSHMWNKDLIAHVRGESGDS